MPKFLIIYHMEDRCNSCTFTNSENASNFTKMLRDFGYNYEFYVYTDEHGFIRTSRWPAQI